MANLLKETTINIIMHAKRQLTTCMIHEVMNIIQNRN